MSGADLEVEVKFLVADHAALRQRLLALGAAAHKPRIFERNIRFDNVWGGLLRGGKLLRLRQDAGASLTFKGPAPEDAASEVKVRQELEVTVSDFDTMLAILEKVGFAPVQVYEKYRETFRLGALEVVLDELPFGNFIELEGPEADIKTAAARLDLPWAERVLLNYLALMERTRAFYDLPFKDLTFANFANRPVSLATVLAAARLNPDTLDE